MKIHKAQRDAFEARAAETFPERVRALLSAKLPERRLELEGERGLGRVTLAIDRARARGFEGERDVCKLVALSYVLGEAFAAEPWAAAVLDDPRHETPTDRIDALWAAAEQRELDAYQAELTRALR
jgi:hypothetical protein